MSKIPTAEEKLKVNFYNGSFIEIHSGDFEDVKNIMIEFAKLHVEAALKEASESKSLCTAYADDGLDYREMRLSEESVLNAYPLTNIK